MASPTGTAVPASGDGGASGGATPQSRAPILRQMLWIGTALACLVPFGAWVRGPRLELQGGGHARAMLLASSPMWIWLLLRVVLRFRSHAATIREPFGLPAKFALIFMAIYGGLVTANSHFERSVPRRTEWRVEDILDGRKKPTLRVAHADGTKVVEIEVTRDVADGVAPGHSKLVLTTRAGAFGWLRIVDFQPLPLPPALDVQAERSAYFERQASERPRGDDRGHDYVLVVIVLGILAIWLVVTVWRVTVLARALGARRRRLGIAGVHDRLEYRLSDGWLILVPPPARGLLSASLQGDATRLARRLRLARQATSGDADFDREIFVAAEPHEAGEALVSSNEMRLLMRRLLADRESRLRLDEDGLKVRCSVYTRARDLAARLEILAQLHDGLRVHFHGVAARQAPVQPGAALVAKIACLAALLASAVVLFGAFGEIAKSTLAAIARDAAWWCLGLSLLAVPIAFRWQRRRLVPPFLMFTTPFLLPFMAWVVAVIALLTLNRVLDVSPPRQVETRLLGYREDRALFEPWDDGAEVVGPLVWPWEPLEIAAPADVIVHLRDGALGYARIVDVERADR